MNAWLRRLTFSFLIIAVFLGYQGYRGLQGQLAMSETRSMVYLVVAVLALGLFFAGLRQRHRPDA